MTRSAPGTGRAVHVVLLIVLTAVLVVVDQWPASASLGNTPDRTWQTNGRVSAIAYAGDVIYLGGSFTRVRPPGAPAGVGEVVRNRAAAFNATTGELLSWNPNVDGAVRAVAVASGGGRVYLGGKFTSVGGLARRNLAAVDPSTGTPQPWTATVGAGVRAIAVRADNSWVYIGGTFTQVNGQRRVRVAALSTTTGGVVAGFAPSFEQPSVQCPPRCAPVVATLALTPDGSGLYVGGTFSQANGQPRNSAAKVNATTGALLWWNPSVYSGGSVNHVLQLAVLGPRVYVCGDYWAVGGAASPNLAAVNTSNGARDTSWVATTDGGVNACAVSDTTLYIGGHFDKAGGPRAKLTGVTRHHVAAISASTAAVEAWDPGANSVPGVYAFGVSATRLGVGGDFTKIGNNRTHAQQGFAQFSGDP
jgi:trimeric autotransporter adhesin